MRRLVFSLVLVLVSTAFAQQAAELSGLVKSEQPLPDGTRVDVNVISGANSVWGLEVASVTPVAGTFKITAKPIPADQLRPFRGGSVVLPGLQNEYTVKAADGSGQVSFAVGRLNMYVDKNGNGVFDKVTDPWFLGVASLEKPVGFFSLLYVDRDAILTGGGSQLDLKKGWNVFTVRFPGDKPVYAVQPSVNDIVLDVFLP